MLHPFFDNLITINAFITKNEGCHMKRFFNFQLKPSISILLIFGFLVSCGGPTTQYSSQSTSRNEIVTWARKITSIEKQIENVYNEYLTLTRTITSSPPTSEELDELTDYSNRMTSLYNKAIDIDPPNDARSVHRKTIEFYGKITDSVRYYVLAINQNDLDYFDKSVIVAKDANELAKDLDEELEILLDRYSISCEEIDYCE